VVTTRAVKTQKPARLHASKTSRLLASPSQLPPTGASGLLAHPHQTRARALPMRRRLRWPRAAAALCLVTVLLLHLAVVDSVAAAGWSVPPPSHGHAHRRGNRPGARAPSWKGAALEPDELLRLRAPTTTTRGASRRVLTRCTTDDRLVSTRGRALECNNNSGEGTPNNMQCETAAACLWRSSPLFIVDNYTTP
jgi:hypothetical protein